ncbi:unnamed protein product, partial [Amoebophrya sp. A25]
RQKAAFRDRHQQAETPQTISSNSNALYEDASGEFVFHQPGPGELIQTKILTSFGS